MTDQQKLTYEEIEAKLEKIERRAERNARYNWSRGFLDGICALLSPRDLVIDCSANVGDVSAKFVETGAQVIAFEPDPYCFGQLQKRFADVDNIELRHQAVGVTTGSVKLLRGQHFGKNPKDESVKSTVVQGSRGMVEDGENTIDVKQIDFLDFVRAIVAQNGEIAFLKMDIEGAELDLIEKMHEENLFENIRSSVVETYERKFKELRLRFKALKASVAEHYSRNKLNLDWV